MFKSEFVSKYYVKGFDNKWTGEVEYTYKYSGMNTPFMLILIKVMNLYRGSIVMHRK